MSMKRRKSPPLDLEGLRLNFEAPPSVATQAIKAMRRPQSAQSFGDNKPFKDIKRLTGSIHAASIDGCDLRTMVSQIAFKPPNSSSPTIILVGMLIKPETPIIMKISPALDETASDNSLFVETAIYTSLINKMFFERITPHITPYLGTFRCNDFVRSIKNYITDQGDVRRIRKAWSKNLEKSLYNTGMSSFAANFIVLQMNKGISLHNFINTLKLDVALDHSKLVSLLFQIVYTLHCFQKAGLRHNDLHFSNILVEIDSPISELSYFIDKDTVYTVPTYGLIAKIYDFDRATLPGRPNNLLDGEFCKSYGTCNGVNPIFDIHAVIHTLYFEHLSKINETPLKSGLQKIIKKLGDTVNLYYVEAQHSFARPHLMCKPGVKPKTCDGEYDWVGKDLPTPEVFLRTLDVFQQFKQANPAVVNTSAASTFFVDAAIRDLYNVRFTKAPMRPVINRQYVMKCLTCNTSPTAATAIIKGHSQKPISSSMLLILTSWLAEVIKHLRGRRIQADEHRKMFTVFDEIFEYVKQIAVSKNDLQQVGTLFLYKFYGFDMDDLVKVSDNAFTIDKALNMLPDVLNFEPSCNSTIEYLFYCVGVTTTQERRALKKRYSEVVDLMAKMYSNTDWYMISSMSRAQWIKEKILTNEGADPVQTAIFHATKTTKASFTTIIASIIEPVPKYAA